MSTTRMSSGLAFTPEKDLAMFADMARQGQRLAGTSLADLGWHFEDAEPEEAVFDMACQADPGEDYFDIFRAAGWTPVLSYGHIHFFKAAPGTTPVHTGVESQIEEVVSHRAMFLRYTAVTVVVLAVALLALAAAGWPLVVTMATAALGAVALVFTGLPIVGFSRRLHRLRHTILSG